MNDDAGVTLRGERGFPPYFAGRKPELAHLRSKLNNLCLDARSGGRATTAKEGIVLITGVPGVGKTYLAEKFIEEAEKDRRQDGTTVSHLIIDTSILEDPVTLLKMMGEVLGAKKIVREAAEIESRVKDQSAGVGGVVQGRVGYDHARHTGKLGGMLWETARAGVWHRKALILVIDELQGIMPQGMGTLAMLHQGNHGCPMLVIGVGLQHTTQVLGNPGGDGPSITRIEEPLALDSLSPTEAEHAIYEGMKAIGQRITKSQAGRIAEGTFGFPQHINGHLRATQRVCAERQRELRDADIEQVLELGAQFRINYYRGRLAAMGQDADFVPDVAAMIETSNGVSLRRNDATKMLDGLTQRETGTKRGAAVIETAIKHGVLTADFVLGTVSFGIPSFQSYMVGLHRDRGSHGHPAGTHG